MKTALAVVETALRRCAVNFADDAAEVVVAALEANGYVPLPRDLLLPLLDAVPPVTVGERNSEDYALLHATWRAVVEAVGPTKEGKQ